MVEKILKLFNSDLKMINIGLEIFKKDLELQKVDVVQISWQPYPKLEKVYEDILAKIL